MNRNLVISSAALLLIFAGVARAQPATAYVWFEAAGLNPQSGVATQGVEGGNLGLTCDTNGGPAVCEWRVQMRFHNLVQLASMGTDLLGDTSLLAISDATHGDFPGPGYTGQGHNYQTPNAGGTLAVLKAVSVPVDNNNQYVLSQGAPGFYNPVSFTLTATKPGGGDGLDLISTRINNLLWAHVLPSGPEVLAVVGFGDAPVIPGNIEGGIAPGVIQIQSVPEPATGMLLVIAAAGLMRRSNRSMRPERI